MEKTENNEILELKDEDLATVTGGKMIVNHNMASLSKICTGVKISNDKDSPKENQ